MLDTGTKRYGPSVQSGDGKHPCRHRVYCIYVNINGAVLTELMCDDEETEECKDKVSGYCPLPV